MTFLSLKAVSARVTGKVHYSYPPALPFVLAAQKNRLNETVLLSTHNICFSSETRKLENEIHSFQAIFLLQVKDENVGDSLSNVKKNRTCK